MGTVRHSAHAAAGDVGALAAFIGARRPGVIHTSESSANVSVSEVAAFDGPYNMSPRRAAHS